MIINLTSDFDGINVNRNSFYKSENEREEWLKQAEKIAYEQLVVELSKNGKKNLIPNIGVNHANYLDGGLCINRDGEYWLVYHSERNQKSRLCLFESSYDAANFYLWSVLSNPSKENTSIGRIPKLGTF